jgi:predicted O-methyltransferase YrrM
VTAFQAYEACRTVWTDMQDHLPYLFEMSHGKVLEIGVRGGASTSALLAGVESKGGHLWSVDINNCRLLEHPDWTFIQADSNAEKQKVLAEIPDALDLLFVDGDHTYAGCMSDLETYGSRAKVVLIHDCLCPDTFPGVRRACEEYAAKNELPFSIREGSYGLGVMTRP